VAVSAAPNELLTFVGPIPFIGLNGFPRLQSFQGEYFEFALGGLVVTSHPLDVRLNGYTRGLRPGP
jgi:hypothetical protein